MTVVAGLHDPAAICLAGDDADVAGATTEATAIEAAVRELKAIDEQIADVRQTVWET